MADDNKTPTPSATPTLEEMAKQMEEAAKAKGATTPSAPTTSPTSAVTSTPPPATSATPTAPAASSTPTLEEMAKQMEEAAKKTESTSQPKPEETKVEETKTEEVKSENPKSEEPKPEEVKTEEPKSEPDKEVKTEKKAKSKKSPAKDETKEQELITKNTDPEVLELVEDIHDIAEQLEDLNESIEKDAQAEKLASASSSTASPVEASTTVIPTPTPASATPETPTVPLTDSTAPKIVKQNFFQKIFTKKKKVDEKTESTPTSPTPATTTETTTPLKKKKKLIFIIIIALVIGLLAFAGVSAVLAKSAYDSLRKSMTLGQEAVALLKSQNLPEASKKLGEVHSSLQAAQIKYSAISYLKIVPYFGKFVTDGKYALKAAMAGVEAGQVLIDTINPYADLFGLRGEGSFTGGTTEERIALILSKMGEITPNLDKVNGKLEEVQTNLTQIDPNDYPENFRNIPVRSYIFKAESLLSQANSLLSDAKPMLSVLPQVFGHPDKQKYMILFQNDGELRATGGFMSAYSLVNVEKGKVTPESSNDIYHLDNQFKQIIMPPDFIKTHLNEKKLFLRNMNTSPDFKVSMATFYENYSTLSDATTLNGIIAIDTYVLEKIIEILGPVEVPGYGTFTTETDERCNLPQIVCELEYIVDKPLATVKSNRKADILGPMMKAILDKTFQGGNEQLGKLVPLALDLLEQKHIQAYFTNDTVQQAGEAFNITGRISDFSGDYLHINDSNLGGAKSNFYITQEVASKIEKADDGTLKKTVEISYTHNEPADNCNLEKGDLCLSGIQRNYFRVYVPKGSVLEKGLGSQVEIGTGEELGKTYFDGFFELRPESKAKVMLVYSLPFKLEGNSYKLLTQKQAGTRDVKHTVEFSSGAAQEFILHKDTEIEIKF